MEIATSLAQTLYTYNFSNNGSTTGAAARPGKRWVCYHLYVERSVTNDQFKIRSGSADLTGNLGQNSTAIAVFEWRNAPLPVFTARAINEALVINQGAGTAQLDGFAVVAWLDQDVRIT